MRLYRNIVVAAIFSLVTACFAQDVAKTETQTPAAAPTPAWSGEYRFDLLNKYLGSFTGGVFANQPVAWQELDVTRTWGKTSLTWTLWNSTGFRDVCSTFACETDVDTKFSRQFGKYTASVAEWFFLLNPTVGTHVLAADVKLSREFVAGDNTFTPYIEGQGYRLTNKMSTMHGGKYFFVGGTYKRSLPKKISVELHFHQGFDANGAFGAKSKTQIFFAEITPRFAITKSLSVGPEVGYGGSWNDPSRRKTTMFGGGISKTF
jgi:hypothetical protein